jgi:primosomal protein N' (replication factor Y)
MQRKLDEVHASGPAILVGTQMLAKGHHFPKLTTAVILDVDYALMSSDFRATEHLIQLVTQVAGRTGRETTRGEVLLQTEFAGHPVLADLVNNNYSHFAKDLLEKRKQWSLPPFSFMAILRAESEDHLLSQNLLVELVGLAENSELRGYEIIGPVPSPTEKRSGRYRYQIQISASARSALHALLSLLVDALDQRRYNKKLRWHLDIDPASLD